MSAKCHKRTWRRRIRRVSLSNRAFFHDRFIGFAERGPLLDGDDSKLLRHATCDELFRMAVRKKHAVVTLEVLIADRRLYAEHVIRIALGGNQVTGLD